MTHISRTTGTAHSSVNLKQLHYRRMNLIYPWEATRLDAQLLKPFLYFIAAIVLGIALVAGFTAGSH